MRQVYMLIPLCQIQQNITIEAQVQKIIKIPRNQFTIYQINQDAFGVEVQDFGLSFIQLNQILSQKISLQSKFSILQNTLKNYQFNSHQNPIQSINLQSLISKAKKYKQVKQENKKLRKLLQIQLENTEKVREQTQKTMKALKQQFDALVNQMNKTNIYHKNTSHSKGEGGSELKNYQHSR